MESRRVYYDKGNTGFNIIFLILQMHKYITDGHIFWYLYLQIKQNPTPNGFSSSYIYNYAYNDGSQGLNPGFLAL